MESNRKLRRARGCEKRRGFLSTAVPMCVCVRARTSERVKASEVVYVLVNQRLPVEPPWVQQGEFKFIVSSIQLLTTNTGKL